jgi:hypothetical protein
MSSASAIHNLTFGSKPTTVDNCVLYGKAGHINTEGGHSIFVAQDESDNEAWFKRQFPQANQEITLVPGKAFVAEPSFNHGELYLPMLDLAISCEDTKDTNNQSLVVWREKLGKTGSCQMAYLNGSLTQVPSHLEYRPADKVYELSSLKFGGSYWDRPRGPAKNCTEHQFNLTDKDTQIVDIPGTKVAWYHEERLQWVKQRPVSPSIALYPFSN